MSNKNWTPGPWGVVENCSDKSTTVCAVGKGIDVISCSDNFVYAREVIANAHLISAAPELYEALEEMRHHYIKLLEAGREKIVALGGYCDSVEVMARNDMCLRATDAALAKSRGEK